jgi:hypothetical protein
MVLKYSIIDSLVTVLFINSDCDFDGTEPVPAACWGLGRSDQFILSPNQSRTLLEAQTNFSDRFPFLGNVSLRRLVRRDDSAQRQILLSELSAALQD